MLLERFFLLEKFGLPKRDFVAFSFSLINTLAWYFMTQQIIENLSTNLDGLIYQKVTIMGIYYLAIVLSSLCNAFIALKIKRRVLLLMWIGLGIIASLLPLIIAANSFESLTLVSFLFGFSFGIGIPSCLSFLADETVFENRGRAGGLIFSLASILAVLFVIFNVFVNDFMLTMVYVAVWRTANLCIFRLADLNKREIKRTERTSFTTILRNKPFLFYLMPWLMFSLVDSLEKTYLQSYILSYFGQSFFTFNQLMEALIGALFAIIAGTIMDLIGRKRVIVYGFISLGLAYATVGIAPYLDVLWYFYSIVDGIAWGIFIVIFTVVIWGDLSTPSSFREKYYTLGGIPLFISKFIGTLFLPYTQALPKETAYAAFSLAAFFLFLAVVPLMYAPETLPEKKLRERELRSYIEKAKKVKEKFT
jgi:MFS family permease